ncbi:MAG: hypothetical protein IPH48_04520 [bacterium]|nr:hypothetical protein [bacterium]
MFKKFLMAAALLLAASPAAAVVDLLASCDQATGTFEFTIVVVNDLVAGDPAGYEIVLEQTLAGSCDKPTLASLPTMPLPAWQQEATYTVSLAAPWPERTWHYRAALRQSDGSVELLGPFGNVTPVAALAWGTAPAVRGVLMADDTGPFHHVVACVQDCGRWLSYDAIDLSRIHPAQYEPFLRSGEAVDIYGELQASVPVGGPRLYATAVEPSRGDPCAPTPTSATSWGSLKSAYR